MPEYKVVYESELIADTPQRAAEWAFDMMQDGSTYPPVLGVTDLATGEETTVDMAEEI